MFLASHRRRVRVYPALAVTAALLVGASCSSDDDASESTTPDATAGDTAAPEETAAPDSGESSDTAATEAPSTEDSAPVDTSAGESGGDDFDPYAQTLEWTECAWGECAEATVPIDYDDPSVGTTTIALSRIASTGDDPIGTLLVNPGGPGESGLPTPENFEFDAAPEILESYNIVGFDPRGVGESDPLGCLDDAALDESYAQDVDPDNPASVDAYAESLREQGEACLETNPELAQHVTTVETAKDLDVLRELVGDDQLSFFGFSYGTFLGATYAALFPDKVGRMVLDGPEDPSLSESEKTLRTLDGLQLAFDDYAADCVANDCPLGSSVEEVEQQVSALFETTMSEPLPTDDSERPLTRPLAFLGVVAPLYNQAAWPDLTEALAAAADGDGSALLNEADAYVDRQDGTYVSNRQVITAINCLDAQLVPPSESAPGQDEFVEASPVFGQVAYATSAVGCDEWPIEPTVTAPDYAAPGTPPILVVGTTGDPVTPIESARQLAEQLDSGVLLVRDGDGHTAYFSGNECITDAVNAYLLDGTAPEDGTECAEPAPSEDETEDDFAQDVALIVGDDLVVAEWTECSWDGSALALTAEGSGVEIEATTGDDGTVEVTVSGSGEVTLTGTAEEVEGTLIVSGTATADGTTSDATLSLDATTCA